MRIVAEGWNEGNARKASDCFTEDAVYLEPPNRQLYVGRRAIYDFFGRPTKPQPPMRMEWHHLAFKEREQVGYGEYTFQMNHSGIVTVLIQNGKLASGENTNINPTRSGPSFAGKSRF